MIQLANQRKTEALGVHKSINHEFKVGIAEDLSEVKDESVDTYISNLCIHLVPDENQFLQEAKRVLKKGGRIGLTVPTKENCFFMIVHNKFVEAGSKTFPGRGPYYLGSREAMIKLLQDNGFEVEACWDDHYKCPFYTDESIDLMTGVSAYNQFDKDVQVTVREKILNEFRNSREKFEPSEIRLVSIVAKKPS